MKSSFGVSPSWTVKRLMPGPGVGCDVGQVSCVPKRTWSTEGWPGGQPRNLTSQRGAHTHVPSAGFPRRKATREGAAQEVKGVTQM